MFPRRQVPFGVAACTLILNFCSARLAAQRLPSPQALKNEMQMRALPQPDKIAPDRGRTGPASQLIATSTLRIDRDGAVIRVYRNGRLVELFPHFQELLVATPADHPVGFDTLVGRSVALVPSEKRTDRWDIYLGVGGVYELTLAGNIFVVGQVFLSSRKSPIEVQAAGKIYRLKPGQALLLI